MEATDVRIELEHTYAHPIDRVWKAISDEKEIAAWFIKADFQPIAGYKYTFTHESTVITGEVLVARRPTELTYTWIVGNVAATSTVCWRLEAEGENTRVVLTHTGIESYGDSAAQMFTAFQTGWKNCLTELEGYLGGEESGG